MTKETEEAVDRAIEKNNEEWRIHVKYEKDQLIARDIAIGAIAALTAFGIGWIVGAKIGL